MPWTCKTLFTVAAFAVGCSMGGISTSEEKKEFDALENSLLNISDSPQSDWRIELNNIRKKEIHSKDITEIRNLCVAAYDAFAEANIKLQAARLKVAEVENKIAAKMSAQANTQAVSHADALKSTDDVSNTLDRAEALINSCMLKRREKRAQLAGHP